ncbi:hypothetical protein QYF36_010500 [Acer negundo]|nr:hypothetical protein QYF36_010500 [Acer negundo]
MDMERIAFTMEERFPPSREDLLLRKQICSWRSSRSSMGLQTDPLSPKFDRTRQRGSNTEAQSHNHKTQTRQASNQRNTREEEQKKEKKKLHNITKKAESTTAKNRVRHSNALPRHQQLPFEVKRTLST